MEQSETVENSSSIVSDLNSENPSYFDASDGNLSSAHLLVPVVSWETVQLVSYWCAILNIFLVSFGIIGNCLSIVVFCGKRLRKVAVNILLIGLSVTDLLLLIACIPVVVFPQSVFAFGGFSYGSILDLIHYSFIFVYPAAVTFQTISVSLFMGITCERFIAVCHPLKAKIYCTTSNSKTLLFATFVFSILYNSVRFWEYTLKSCKNGTSYCNSVEAVKFLGDNRLYKLYYMFIIPAVLALLACVFMTAANLWIVHIITRAKKQFTHISRAVKQEHKTAIMIIIVIAVFLVCYGLHLCMYFYKSFNPEMYENFSSKAVAYLFDDISKSLIILNSASTWVFYCMSDSYRNRLKRILRGDCTDKLIRAQPSFRTDIQLEVIENAVLISNKSSRSSYRSQGFSINFLTLTLF